MVAVRVEFNDIQRFGHTRCILSDRAGQIMAQHEHGERAAARHHAHHVGQGETEFRGPFFKTKLTVSFRPVIQNKKVAD